MFYARVPADIQIVDQVTEAPQGVMRFRDYAVPAWCNDSKWTTPISRIDSLRKVLAEIKRPAGEVMSFEDADRQILLEVIADPSQKQVPFLLVQVGAFSDAITNATQVKPEG